MVVWGHDLVPARFLVTSAALPHQNFAEFLMTTHDQRHELFNVQLAT